MAKKKKRSASAKLKTLLKGKKLRLPHGYKLVKRKRKTKKKNKK